MGCAGVGRARRPPGACWQSSGPPGRTQARCGRCARCRSAGRSPRRTCAPPLKPLKPSPNHPPHTPGAAPCRRVCHAGALRLGKRRRLQCPHAHYGLVRCMCARPGAPSSAGLCCAGGLQNKNLSPGPPPGTVTVTPLEPGGAGVGRVQGHAREQPGVHLRPVAAAAQPGSARPPGGHRRRVLDGRRAVRSLWFTPLASGFHEHGYTLAAADASQRVGGDQPPLSRPPAVRAPPACTGASAFLGHAPALH